MKCPICGCIASEIINKSGTTYSCTNIIVKKDNKGIIEKQCTWSGMFVPNKK